jgi:diadenosine tetraphosphatase ApaH/serine/threonine PP2A family protein phosphatase
LLARGPDSKGVLALVRRLGSRAVLGNHEQRLLQVRSARQRAEPGLHLGHAHLQLLHELTEQDWALLEALPLYLEVREHRLCIVHAGIVPGVALEDQDPWLLTHLRSIDASGNPTDKSGPIPWGARYPGPVHIVFGHNALAGIQLHPFATGLDSGCVYGGELTALVLEAGQEPPPVAERRDVLVSVRARHRYFSSG